MLKNHKLVLNLIWIVILILVPLPLISILEESIVNKNVLGINFGLIAYSLMLSSIYLATKPKWLDNLVGLPDIYLIHGVLSIVALVLMYLHEDKLKGNGLVELTGDFTLYASSIIIAYSLVFMSGWLTSRIYLLNVLKNILEKIFKHEISIWIHRINLVATLVVYLHILLIDYIRENILFMIVISVYTIFVFGLYFVYIIKKHKKDNAKILKIIKLDVDIVQIDIEVNKNTLKKINAGDFVFISFKNNKKLSEQHPFSVVNVPNIDGFVRLAVSCVGDFTRELANVKQDTQLLITKGYGIIDKIVKNETNLVLIAGGIGITSLLSVADKYKEKNIKMIYTVKSNKKILYKDKLEDMIKNEKFELYYKKGRLTEEEKIKEIPIRENIKYIIAGPMQMNISYTKYLKEKNIKANKIYYESFNF